MNFTTKFVIRDLRKHLLRNILSISAIIICVGVITSVNGVVDSLGHSSVALVIQNQSEVDLSITHIQGDTLANVSTLIQNIEEVEGIAGASARWILDASLNFYDSQGEKMALPMTLIAFNFSKESDLSIGEIEPAYNSSLGLNKTLLVGDIGGIIFQQLGSNINMTFSHQAIGYPLSLEIVDVVENKFRFPNYPRLALVDLGTIQQYTGNDTANSIVSVFTGHDMFYSAIDLSLFDRVKKIAIDVQNKIGLEYQVNTPLATILKNIDFTGQRIFLNFIAVIMIILAGILIFSLFTISVEEKTREFSIIRVSGARGSKILAITLIHAFLLSIIGCIIGILLGGFLSTVFVSLLFANQEFVEIYVSPTTYVLSALLGLGLGLCSSFLPAKKAMNRDLVSSLEGTQQSYGQSKIVRERGPSRSLIILGLALSFGGGLLFTVFPLLTALDSPELSSIFFLGLLLSFIVGAIALVVGGIAPLAENVVVRSLSLFARQIGLAVTMFVRKNRRRNNLTSLLFAVSLCFILYLNVSQTLEMETQITIIDNYFGADLVLQGFGSSQDPYINQSVLDYLNKHSLVDSIGYTSENGFLGLIGCLLTIGDIALWDSHNPSVYGISDNIPSALFEGTIATEGSFSEISTNNTVVLSNSLAVSLGVGIGDIIRARVNSPIKAAQDVYGKELNLTITGLVSKMPGFLDIHEQERYAAESAIFIGNSTWNAMAKGKTGVQVANLTLEDHIQRVFIKTTTGNAEDVQQLQIDLFLTFGISFTSIRASEVIENLREDVNANNNLLTLILSFSILIAFFAVISSTQTSVMEARREIGIIKAIGLSDNLISLIFVLESFTLTLVSTVLGGLVGYLIAYLLNFQTAVALELPLIFVMPSEAVWFVYILSIFLALIGAFIPSRGIARKQAAEILREY
ncbi:MAG: FtsX-like permease family protein [Candidatus Hodarchaeota archaeon]